MSFIKDFEDFVLNESLPLEWAKEVASVKRDEKAEIYMLAFWNMLKDYANSHGGFVSRNGYRIYINCPKLEPKEGTSDTMTLDGLRSDIYNTIDAEINSRKNGSHITGFDYFKGTVTISYENGKPRELKIGKLIKNKTMLDQFANDPFRLTKNLKGKDFLICISNHSYDIAGMSADRNWTSCMNLYTGEMRQYVYEDIKHGTLIAYIIEKSDTNINHPIGRVLIKPYKLARKDYHGTDRAPVVYSPEVTVYSPFVGLNYVRDYLKEICEEIQSDKVGTLRAMKDLYNDTYHDKADKKFNIK